MTLRFLSSTTISDGLPSARRAVAAAVLVLAGATVAHAAPDAASAAAGDQAAPLTITVRPGQSLNDIAVAITQSHDPAVLARAGRALFDANPQAFMKRDPSRLKIGAQLAVPTLDATGAAAGAAASGAAASGAASASAAGAASHAVASAATAAASHPAATSMSTASHAAAALAASAAAGTASSANGASAPGAASTHAPSAAAQAAASAASSSVGGPHVWSGSIQQAPAAASGASAAGAEALLVPGAANLALSGSSAQVATGASQARPSSLQQLLALKNRVLMELQKHGIGKPAANGALTTPAPVAGRAQKPQASAVAGVAASAASGSEVAGSEAAATAGSTTSAASAPAVTPPVSAASRTAVPQLTFNSGAAIAVGAAVVALIAGFALRRRKKGPPADAIEPGAFTPAPALDPDAVAAIAGAPAAADAAAEETREAGGQAATAAAHHESPIAPPAEAKTAPTKAESTIAESKSALEIEPDSAATRGPQTPPVEPLTLKMPQPDERNGAPRVPESDDAQSSVPQTGAKPVPYAWRQAFPRDAISALDSLDMPLPPRASNSDDVDQTAESQHAEPAGSGSLRSATNGQAAARQPIGVEDTREVGTHGEATPGADRDGGESLRDETPVARPWAAETHQATPPSGAEQGEAAAPVAGSPAIESQSEGQRRQDASGAESQAFAAGAGGSGAGASQAAASGAAQPLTSTEATPHADEPPQTAPQQAGDASPQAAAPHEAGTPGVALPYAHAEPPLAAPQPGASFAAPSPAAPSREPAAPSPNLPPLGVAQFGALNLDFDLDLPTGPSASLPAFTPEALAKIARNKLELASEYVELGDLAGARTLLHEVIEAGHADTRDEAHVMLAKLADLS
ncbi:FimV/HubP family polar landmark protein [Burkholderia mayonis]|uniref:Pilus assembly protein FimV n=1 Tax=Burkholderia mayonis TaxID=1385591 RepID=A0A1B4FS06_9BURK|nr:FimV/HubP family polar landmark protein [Burkholderia mayonis]AOJ06438.1 hypothetical protein WS71_03180 [Burkholderia mayonis]KVE51617.1 hypothetical protein WS71_11265 [Burkholderia mayonis]